MALENIKYKKPLVIGMGGGNDIVSSTIILSYLKERVINADLAGISSPGAWHNYNGKEEEPVNLVSKNTIRYIDSKNPVNISYIDPQLPTLLEKENINARVYNLSLRYGTNELIKGLEQLIEEQRYDGIIAVDIGGDVLARGKQHSTILSPLMDFSTLYVINQLNTPSILVEFGLQTDGELRPDSCKEILEDLERSNAIPSTFELKKQDKAIESFKRIYSEIEKIRHGHTANMTLETLEKDEDIHAEYRSRVRVLDKKWYFNFPITLEKKYFGKGFIIDPKVVFKKTQLSFPFNDPFELYIKMKKKIDTRAEMDMLYSKPNNTVVWLGVLCPQIKGKQRGEVLNYGLQQLEVHADVGLFWKKDEEFLEKGNRKSEHLDDFILIGSDENKLLKVKNKIQEILK